MKFDPIEIIDAWFRSLNPNEKESNLARERLDICMGCDFRKEVIRKKKWSALCGKCGCPIQKKIFTDQYGSCPLNKWDGIEKKYIGILSVKEKSII